MTTTIKLASAANGMVGARGCICPGRRVIRSWHAHFFFAAISYLLIYKQRSKTMVVGLCENGYFQTAATAALMLTNAYQSTYTAVMTCEVLVSDA
jgi:hypothetical protein